MKTLQLAILFNIPALVLCACLMPKGTPMQMQAKQIQHMRLDSGLCFFTDSGRVDTVVVCKVFEPKGGY